MTRALVTGATGMLGRQLVEWLLAAGVEVRAFARPSSDLRHLRALPVEIVSGEATDLEAIRHAVTGCRWVYHAAAYFHLGSAFSGQEGFDQYRRANVDFTEALLTASQAAGVARFIYVSSTAVYSLDAPTPIPETAPLIPDSDYGRSKLMAEALVQAYQQRGLATTTVRPCITYGPGDRHFLPAALGLARLPVLPLVEGGSRRLDLVYVGDVVELLWRASQAEAAIGKVYNAASGAAQPLRTLFEDYRALSGSAPRLYSVSLQRFQSLAPLARWYLRKLAPGVELLLSPAGVAYMARDVDYDMSQAKQDLGYTPQFNFRRGLALALRPYP